MTKRFIKGGWEQGGRYSSDPIGSQHTVGRSRSLGQTKSGRDPGLTPTERTHKGKLMKQFCSLESGIEDPVAYRASPCWCDCERGLRGESGKCARCEAKA